MKIISVLRTAAFRALALAIAVQSPAVAAGAPGRPADASAVDVTPAHIALAVKALDAIAKKVQQASGVPGMSIAVVHDGRVLFTKGYGTRRIGTNERVDADTIFQLASVSKSLAATVVAAAVGNGRVKWADPVARYLPGFTLRDPYVGAHVTIADMFAHRSGLPDHAGDLLEDLGYDRAQVIAKLALEPLAPFRITYAYTNFGFTAGAEAVARAEGTTWEALSQSTLYGPLGMTSTSSRWSDFDRATNKAMLHVRNGNGWAVGSRRPDAQSPAGGASSSARDMAKWMILELGYGMARGKQIVPRAPLLETQLPNLRTGPLPDPLARPTFYGLGMNVSYDDGGRLRLGHSGAFALGAATAYDLLPSERLGIVVLTNGVPTGVPEAITKTFFDIVEYGAPKRDWYAAFVPVFAHLMAHKGQLVGKTAPARPAPAPGAETYAGTYANAYYGQARVDATGDGWTLELGPQAQKYPLRHWDGNVFAFVPPGENTNGISAVTFAPASANVPATMTIEYLNETGLATFTKL